MTDFRLQLKQGVPISTSRTDVDYVVAEYGVASLRYRSLRGRAKALVTIAHPELPGRAGVVG